MSEWLLFNANPCIFQFQLYHGENKLICNEISSIPTRSPQEQGYIFWSHFEESRLLIESTWVHPPFLYLVVSVLNVFLVFYVVYFACFSSFCVLRTQCFQYLGVVHSWFALRFSLKFINLYVLNFVQVSHNNITSMTLHKFLVHFITEQSRCCTVIFNSSKLNS